ncbi:MAG: type III-B CRISPR module RAMP protein Cmr1 [Chloroflexi bacterium]|nr:type III-B CRISPR module RAMP protein Cmr1 [Chloroflexota bacterium]
MEKWRTLTVTLETVTPMFLGGADPRGVPELRAPAFRGALRYWLRALVGAAGEQVMRQHEEHLFGMGGEQATAGAVSLRLPALQGTPTQSYSELVKKRPGIAYLWFTARGTKREPERDAILPTAFKFEMSLPRSKQPAQDLEQAAAVLWLLTRLGGVGARSRRFAGGVQVANVKSNHNLESIVGRLRVHATSPQELVDELANGIESARNAFGIQQLANPAPDQFDVLHPDRCQIFVLVQSFDSWQDAVEKIGQIYQSFRALRQPDYNVVKTAMTSGNDLQGTVKRAAFGLPIPFFYRSLGNRTATLQAEERQGNDISKIDRRASPLWMRAVKLSNCKYAVVFTWFKSRFLPANAEFLLTERQQLELRGKQLPNDQLIQMFLTGVDPEKHSALSDADYSVLEVPLQ